MNHTVRDTTPVRCARIRLFRLELPLQHSFQTSSHRKSGIEHILVELTDTDGVTGWGEIASPSDPFYCAESTDTAWHIAVKYLVPAIMGAAAETPEELERSWSKIRGHEFAKAGFSGAIWDLFAKREGISLSNALGGTRASVVAGVSLGIEPSLDALVAEVESHVAAGYPRVKLKIAPGWDVAAVRAVREVHPDIDLHVDANGAYLPGEGSTAIFRELDQLGLTMIEQPFGVRDFIAHSDLQARIDTPICLDESVVDLEDIETMLRLDAGRVLNIKVSRMGGLTRAKRAHDIAQDAGIPVWCGGMHEFGIGRAANVALSSLPNFLLPSDVSGSDKYYANDIINPPVRADHGVVTVPSGPGIGYSVDVKRIERDAALSFDSAAVESNSVGSGGPVS